MESMRRLNFGHHKHAEFAAHVHILDLHNVPLVEGECRLKWRFQNGMNLNTTNNEKVMGQALQTSVSYLKDLRNAAAGGNSDDRGGAGDYGDDASSPNGEGDHSLGGRFKDAISHASRTLRASTLSHGSGDQTSPRSRSLSMPRSGNGHHNPTSPTTEPDHPIWRTTAPTDYFRQGGEDSHDVHSRPNKPSASHGFFGGNSSASPPSSPKASTSNILSPTTTVRPSGITRQSTALLSPTTPPARQRQSTTPNYNSSANLSRKNTSVPSLDDGMSGHPVSRSPTSLIDSLHNANMPTKAEIKGKTAYMPLVDNQVRFDKHIVCAVAIPLQKNSKHLESSTVRLKVLHKVRTTPLPGSIGSRPAPAAILEDGTASPVSQAIRNHKTRVNGSSVSLSSPGHNGHSTLHINTKEIHEEIFLGELTINLSEFVSVEYASADHAGRTGVGQPKETWITRRYLLQNGKTNALLRVAVKMDWISGVRDFTAPPLMKGQIISPKKQVTRGSNTKNRDKDKEKSSLYSGASSNSSRMYMQGDNASSRSFISTEQTDLRRPLSLRNPLYGRKANSRASPDDASDLGSIAGVGNQNHLHNHGPLHKEHIGGGLEYGLDDEQTDIDIINAIFSKPETPPASPVKEQRTYFENEGHRLQKTTGQHIPLHSDSALSEASLKSHHQSPAQALAFFHRSRDKVGKGKQAFTGQLGVDEAGGKGRKRLSSAPSRSIFPPLRSNSRTSTAASVAAEQGIAGRTDAHDPHHHQHQHHLSGFHEDSLGPVLVHIPTHQEPLDVHSHPFRWRGKSTAATQNLPQGSHTGNSLNGVENDSGYAVDQLPHHATTIASTTSPENAHGSDAGGKRRATTSAAVGLFKMQFKNRSSSVLSRTHSLQSVSPATETAPSHTIPTSGSDDLQSEDASKNSSDIHRGSLDLQKTLRPSSDGDPTRSTLRRMTSPATMTPAEEADLQVYIREHLAGGQEGDSAGVLSTKISQDLRVSDESSRITQPLGGRREAERRHSVSHLQHEIRSNSRQSNQGSSRSSTGTSTTSAVEGDELVRQVTNEETLNERARKLRERGLLPTLSITTSDNVPARSPTGRA